MKRLIIISLILINILSVSGQSTGTQDNSLTATVNKSTRLFASRDDLTSVILIIPSGSIVYVLGSDSTYMIVTYEENQGYIFRKHAKINQPEVNTAAVKQDPAPQSRQQTAQKEISRFEYLENKYGTNIASRLMSGKIWKGMTTEMVQDSWGNARKINRVISGNVVQEEWIFKNNWLYFENDMLLEWGPTKQ